MAENTQTFTLVGNFKDNITPSLKKLNTQLESLSKSFSRISQQLRPISKEFGNMAGASERMAQSLKAQKSAFDAQSRSMQQYRREAAKTRTANEQLARSTQALGNAGGGGRRGRGGVGGADGSGGVGGLGGNGRLKASEVGGAVAGVELANNITNAIVRGFNIGVGIMRKPFTYAAGAIGERIQDEMSDISSAGGMFSVDRRENLGVFKSFDDARQFQEELNSRLAKSAASLPGETSEYVQQAKQLTDSMMIAFGKNKEAFMTFAKSLDNTVSSDRDALGLVTQKFTEKAVLLGKGSGGSSNYGVPQILEQLLSQEQVNVKSFRQFAAYQSNPLFKNALEAAEKDLKKTGANSAERLRILQKVLDQAVPNDVVMAMQNSADGIYQAVKSAFLDPESGLLGFGRKIDGVSVKARDSLGRFVNSAGKVVATAEEAADQTASLFGLLRDIVGGLVLPLTGLTDILPQLYDPLLGIADEMVNFREISQNFYRSFNEYTKGFEDFANELDASGKKGAASMIRDSKKARGALAAINNLLADIGAIDTGEFKKNANLLETVQTQDLGGIAKRMFGQLFDSKFMEMIGDMIGGVVGATLKMVGDVMQGAGDLASSGPFGKGLAAGFEKAQGSKGIQLIFANLFRIIGKTLMGLFKSAPVEMSILGALTVGMPILQGIIAGGMTKLFGAIATSVGTMGVGGGLANMGATLAGWAGVIGPISRALPPIALALTAIVALGGGVENTLRQVKEIFGELFSTIGGGLQAFGDVIGMVTQFTVDLVQGIIELVAAIFNLIPGVNVTTQSLDILKIILVPLTATFQLVEMGLRGLAEGLSNVRLWILKMTNWGGRNDAEIKKAEEELKVNTQKQNESKRRIDVYNTSMRYDGPEGYAKVLAQDIAAKQRKMQSAGLLKGEREKLNNDIHALTKTLAEANKQAGSSVKPQQPGAPVSSIYALPNNNAKPAAPGAPAAPAAAPAAPAAVSPAAITTAATQAVQPATVAVQAGTTATRGVTTAVQTASTEQVNVSKANLAILQKALATLTVGLNNVKSAVMVVSNKVSAQSSQLTQISQNTAKTNSLLESGKLKVTFNLGHVGGKGGPGMVDQFTPMAVQQFGLQVTSGYRPGDPGYHGVNRARDYSNGHGPTPQMMAFAKFMASSFGGSLAELIYTPLGFSIKNGQIVPPYAQAGHYDHVHVAFAQGLNNPRLFTSAKAAAAYEGMMAPAGAKVATITANSSENLGGHTTVNQNITINGAEDPRRLAEMVFNYAAQAAQNITNSSFA